MSASDGRRRSTQCREGLPARLGLETDRRSHAVGHERPMAHRGELHKPHAVCGIRHKLTRDLQCQAGLSGATGADQRNETVASEQCGHFRSFALAADEAGERDGQIVASGGGGADGRKIRRKSRMAELEHFLLTVDVLEAMPPKAAEDGIRRQDVPHQVR